MKNHKKDIPTSINVLTIITFVTSSIVFIEPAPFDVLFIGLLCASVALGYISFPPQMKSAYLLCTAYFLLSLVSVPLAAEIVPALIFHAVTLYLIILSFLICFLVKRFGVELLDNIILTCCYSLTFTSILAIMGYFDVLPIKELITSHGNRLKGLFKDPNVLGPACIFANLFLISYILSGRRWMFNSFCLLICTLALFLTYSRAAWGAFIVAVVVFMGLRFLFNRNKMGLREGMLILFSVIVMLGILLFIMQSDALKTFAMERATLHNYDEDRFAVQQLLLEHSFEHPLGSGPGQTEIFLYNFFSFIEGSSASHSLYVRLIFENGFAAALIFFLFIIYVGLEGFRLCRKKWQYSWVTTPALAVFTSYIVCSFVIDTLHWRHFWIVIGVIFALKVLYPKSTSSQY